jgi:hypothetical protein
MLIMDKEGGGGRKEGRRREGLRGVEGEKKGSRPKRGFGRSCARNDEGKIRMLNWVNFRVNKKLESIPRLPRNI